MTGILVFVKWVNNLSRQTGFIALIKVSRLLLAGMPASSPHGWVYGVSDVFN